MKKNSPIDAKRTLKDMILDVKNHEGEFSLEDATQIIHDALFIDSDAPARYKQSANNKAAMHLANRDLQGLTLILLEQIHEVERKYVMDSKYTREREAMRQKTLKSFNENFAMVALKKGDTVTLVGFGTFSVRKRACSYSVRPCV
jgi:hypothetical protein